MANVTFDGPNLLVIVNNGVTSLDVQVDLYSDWKEWVLLTDNSKFLEAFTAIGGDPIGGGLFVGTTYLMINGWKLRPYEGDHTLTIFGNLFGEGGAEIIEPTIGAYTVAVQYRNSTQAQGISTSGVGTPAEVASAVWDATLSTYNNPNTFGETNQVSGGGLTQTQVAQAVWDANLTSYTTANTFGSTNQYTVDPNTIAGSVWNANVADYTASGSFGEVVGGNIKMDANTAVTLATTLLKYHRNRTRVDTTAKTLTIYDDDNLTPIRVFDLKDSLGNGSVTEIAERLPQ